MTVPRVLVVEDDLVLQSVLVTAAGLLGAEVHTLTDGGGVLAYVQRERPALVLLDIMLPHTTGLDALLALRAAGEQVPVLVLSAYVPVGDPTGVVADLPAAGRTVFMAKPFALDALLGAMRGLLAGEDTAA